MNRANARQTILSIGVALAAIAFWIAVLWTKRVVPAKSPGNTPVSQLVKAEGKNEQGHLGEIEAERTNRTPPDWALYLSTNSGGIKPITGETYPDHPLRGPRPSSSPPSAGPH